MNRVFLQNRIWLIGFRVMSSFVEVVISENELKLLASVEKPMLHNAIFIGTCVALSLGDKLQIGR